METAARWEDSYERESSAVNHKSLVNSKPIVNRKSILNRKRILIETPATFDAGARTQPVSPACVVQGTPVMRTWNVVRSHDLTSDVVVWECLAGTFECHYRQDEVVMVVDGEVFITDETGVERRLAAGGLGFFPAGTSAVWRVPERVRKIAVLRETMARPMGFGLKVWKRVRRIAEVPLGKLGGRRRPASVVG